MSKIVEQNSQMHLSYFYRFVEFNFGNTPNILKHT